MKRMVSTARLLVLICGISMFCGCTTTPPISSAEKAGIKNISISSKLCNEFQYEKIGTTAFQNHTDNFNADKVITNLISSLQEAVVKRGYMIAESEKESDCILIIENAPFYREPGKEISRSIRFNVHTAFGLNPGVEVWVQVVLKLKKTATGEIRSICAFDRIKRTSVKKAPAKWTEFAEDDRRILMEALNAFLLEMPNKCLNDLGL